MAIDWDQREFDYRASHLGGLRLELLGYASLTTLIPSGRCIHSEALPGTNDYNPFAVDQCVGCQAVHERNRRRA